MPRFSDASIAQFIDLDEAKTCGRADLEMQAGGLFVLPKHEQNIDK